jgi:hypothetical protein
MTLLQISLTNRRQVQRFLDLPFHIYRHIPQWVPPLDFEARRMLDPRRHPFYRHSQAAFFLALDGAGAPLGRLAVLENRNYNAFNQARTAFFYLFECFDDRQAALELFAAGCEWARRQGLDQVSGPKGFTALDGMGLLVKGFQHRPAFGIPYNPAYYPALVEAAGFCGQGDVVSGCLSAAQPFPQKIHRLAALVQQRRGLRVARFKTRRHLRALVPRLQALYNGALGGTSGNVPLTGDEAQAMAGQLLWFADPRLIKIVMKDEQPVGFLFAYPDISAAVQRCRGRLWPLGWAGMLLEMRRTKWVNINGAGMLEGYRGLGGTALLFSEMQKSVVEGGFEQADLVQIGVENDKMQRELRDLGVDFYKTHRLYTLAL